MAKRLRISDWVKMRIHVEERSRKLDTISKGDILVFGDREETVEEVDVPSGTLSTRRDFESRNLVGEEAVVYNPVERIYPTSQGKVYDWKKRLK